MGALQRHRERGGADLHLDRRDAAGSVRSGVLEADGCENSLGEDRRAQGCRGRGGVSRLPGGLADQRHNSPRRWRLDHDITTILYLPLIEVFSAGRLAKAARLYVQHGQKDTVSGDGELLNPSELAYQNRVLIL